MKIIVYLPKVTAFDIELDGESFHSQYSDTLQSFSLKQGEHKILAADQSPTPTFWHKLIRLFNFYDQSVCDYSQGAEFTLAKDDNVQILVKYGDYDFVDFIFDV